MSDKITDLSAEREKRKDQPNPKFILCDECGRTYYLFTLHYEMDGKSYAVDIWAEDFADADRRVEAMKASLVTGGQVYERFDA